MYGIEAKLEWLKDYNPNMTIANLLGAGLDIDGLFEIDNYADFQYALQTSSLSKY